MSPSSGSFSKQRNNRKHASKPAYNFTLKLESVPSSEMSESYYQTASRHVPEIVLFITTTVIIQNITIMLYILDSS
jgi:hypothetical protein